MRGYGGDHEGQDRKNGSLHRFTTTLESLLDGIDEDFAV